MPLLTISDLAQTSDFYVAKKISRQATINVGTIGHVAHGKSTVVKALSGVQTVRFKTELERNITIKLGYANAKIYQGAPISETETPTGPLYTSRGSSHPDEFVEEGRKYKLRRHVSFVDCPGHDILMATMLNGAAVMGMFDVRMKFFHMLCIKNYVSNHR